MKVFLFVLGLSVSFPLMADPQATRSHIEVTETTKLLTAFYAPRVELLMMRAAVQGAKSKNLPFSPEKVDAVKSKIHAGVLAEIQEGSPLIDGWRAQYTDSFSADELKTINAFLESPIGKRFIAVDSAIFTQIPYEMAPMMDRVRARGRDK